MQLKTVGQSLNALNSIQNILNDTSLVGARLNIALSSSLNGYSIEVVKAAIAQGTFTAEQVKAILSAKGLTEAEIEEVITTNALTASQSGATASTLGLGTAFKGLGLKIKSTTKAMLAWMATNPIGWITAVVSAIGASIYGVVKLYDALTVSLEEQKEKLQETKEAYENVKNELQEVETELQNTQNKVEELENTPNLSWVEQEELDRLREVTKELELQKQLKQDTQLESAENLYKENEKTFNKEFKSSYGNTSMADLKEQLSSGHIGTGQLDYDNITDIVTALQYINEEKAKLTDEGEIAEYEEFISDLTDIVKSDGQEYLSSLSEYKQNILEIASIRDLTEDEQAFYDYLSSMQKAIYEYYSPATWNNLEFDSIFDTADIEKTKDELVSMYKSGELSSAEMLEQFPKLNEAIRQSELIAGESSDVYKEFFNEIASLADEQVDAVSNADSTVKLFNQLTTSKDAFDQFQSSVKSAADAYSTLMSGNYSSSDLLDSLQAINEAVTDMGGSLNWEFIDGQTQMNSLELLGGAIEHITEKYAESVLSGAGIDVDSKFGQMLANNIVQAQKASTQLEVLNDQIDSLQSAYTDLTDIVDTYNETGYITFDQLQTLLEMEPQYLSCLIDENGQLQLNEVAMAELANRRLDDAEAQAVQQAVTELGQIALQDEKQVVQENAEAFTNAVNDLANYNAELANTIAEASVGAAAIRDLNAAINGAETQGESDDQISTVLDNLNTKLQLIDNVRDKVASGGLASVVKSGSSSSSKSEKDTTKEFDWIEQAIENIEKEVQTLDDVVNSAYSTFSQKNEALAQEIGKVSDEIKLQQQAYDAYMQKAESIGLSDEYKTLIQDGAINIENISDENLQEKISDYQQWYEKAVEASEAISELSTQVKDLHVKGYELQTDRLEELLDNEAITEKQYISEMTKPYKQYYENQTDYAVQAHEAKMALLNREKDYLNSVANAAASLLDREIDKVRDNAEEQAKPYQDRIKEAEKQIDVYEDQIDVFEKQIDAYNKEIDLINDRKKPLEDELDALEDKAREENLILDLQKKQYELKRAENQRDKLLYKDGQMIYDGDPTAVRDARKEVEDAELEIQKNDIQKQIDALDDEIEKYNELIDAINDQIDAVNDQIDAVNDYIDGLNDIVDQINDAADAQVEALEKTKNKWQEVIDQQEEAQNMLLLTGNLVQMPSERSCQAMMMTFLHNGRTVILLPSARLIPRHRVI